MKKISLWFVVLSAALASLSSCQTESSIQLLGNCYLACNTTLSDSVKLIRVVNGSSFHYYEYPEKYTKKSLRFQWDEYSKTWEDYEDSVRWTSPDSSFVMLKYLDGFNYNYPLDSFGDIDIDKIDTVRIREVIDEYFETAEKNAFREYPDVKTEYSCRNEYKLTLCAKSSEKRLFYKIIVAHVEGGMHEFIVLSIEYPLDKSGEYDAIAVDCINYFSSN